MGCQHSEGHHHAHGGHCGGCCGCGCAPAQLGGGERELLDALAQTPFLPVARFVLKSSRSEHLEMAALAPVYIGADGGSMHSIAKAATAIDQLERQGVISVDYEVPLANADASVFERCDAYAHLCSSVREGAANPSFLFDTADIQIGSMALTARGQALLKVLDPR